MPVKCSHRYSPEIQAIRNLKPVAVAAVSLLVFGFAIAVLRHTLRDFDWATIVLSLRAIAPHRVIECALLTVSSYGLLTLYDYVALRGVGRKLPWPVVAPIAFMAYAIGHSVGVSSISGGSVRYRNYSAIGLSTMEIAGVIALTSLTFVLGVSALFGISLLFQDSRAAAVLHLSPGGVHTLGVIVLALIAGYVMAARLGKGSLKILGRVIPLPPGHIAGAQLGIGCVDLCCAAASLYVLLPYSIAVSYPGFIGIYVLAIWAGVLSNIPGGLGVFESVLILLLPGAPTSEVLGAVLLYRVIYYFVPFMLALGLLMVREAVASRFILGKLTGAARRWLELAAPRVLAIAVFVAGAVLLVSGATPEIDARMEFLRDLVPLSVLEFSHLAGSATGVGLLILARGLYQRLDGAWWVTMALLMAGIIASLLKGGDYEEASLLGVLLFLLGLARARFYRRAPLLQQPFSRAWIFGILIVVGFAVWVSVLSYRDVPYERDLLWQVAFDNAAPRAMRAGLLSVLLASSYGLWLLLSPSRPDLPPPTAAEIERAMPIVATGSDTLPNLVLLRDKNLLFDDSGEAFIMYQRSGRSMIAMGDPVGNAKRFPALLWKFRELCDKSAAWPVIYQGSAEFLPLYLDVGLALAKLGEEARVYLPEFSLAGPKRGDLRNEHRRAMRDGVRFVVLNPGEVAANIERLQALSDEWLVAKATAEKGFSVGRFDREYVKCFSHACVFRDQQIVAFATLWQTPNRQEVSVDLMRYGAEAPRGVMDYLFIELMLWAKTEGFVWFDLGMAPLSGLEQHPMAPFWHKLGSLVRQYGATFYNFEGLRRYKEKFSPVWQPRYLASPGGLTLPRVALDAAALIAGGIREVVSK